MERKYRVLGIDFGRKRLGIAISDPMGVIAQPLPTIEYKSLPEALNQIKSILHEYRIKEIVVGYPYNLKGDVGVASHRVDNFVKYLKDTVELSVSLWDERYSSVQAERTIRELGKSPSKNRAKIDAISAVLILQNYLDNQKLRESQ